MTVKKPQTWQIVARRLTVLLNKLQNCDPLERDAWGRLPEIPKGR